MNITAHKIGTIVKFDDVSKLEDVSVDRVYVIAGHDEDGDEYFHDNIGEENFAAATGASGLCKGSGVYKLVEVV